MKARPRKVEREVAKHLSCFYLTYGYDEVARIPVLGRTGPDIEVQAGIAVEVKSRKSNPIGYRLKINEIVGFGELVGVRLGQLHLLWDFFSMDEPYLDERRPSRTVDAWMAHMHNWVKENLEGDGAMSAVVLHWPLRPIAASTFLIYKKDWRNFNDKFGTNDIRVRTCAKPGTIERLGELEAIDTGGGAT